MGQLRGKPTIAVRDLRREVFQCDLARGFRSSPALGKLCQINIERPSQLQEPVEGRARFQGFDVAETRPADSRHFGKPLLGDSLRDPGGTKRTADSFDSLSVRVRLHA
jgi:hypothetical protein